MEFYLLVLVILFGTAIAVLYVGVANDAVNVLNSAVGSRAGTRRTILAVASAGVLIGVTFSSGIMEVARKGIFHPEHFVLHEVMVIFLAVMLTDIMLLDLYNTYGLPTSTTVSVVFALLGGAVALSVIKVAAAGGVFREALAFINTANVFTIVTSIGLSIAFAFVFGVIIQFVTRLIFTFDYERRFRRYGALYCGAVLTAITYFILVKGAEGSSLITEAQAQWLNTNLRTVLLTCLLAWTAVWQALISLTRINVLKIIVLIGTFALALSFAANDLVNFIGAPLAALSAYQISTASATPLTITMSALSAPVRASTPLLLLAGGVMVATLSLSRKARTVTRTEVSLGRQEEGVERFESTVMSRAIVRMSLSFFAFLCKLAPATLQNWIAARFNRSRRQTPPTGDEPAPAFDLLRAAVNLMVASALISFGTSLKLPLSTTFVTFMVAMSTSLADRAWGRESAVYRVNGVLTVIGGWFFTAFLAFATAFLFAFIIFHGKLPAILALVILSSYFYYRSNRIHARREIAFESLERERPMNASAASALVENMNKTARFLCEVAGVIEECYDGLIKSHRKRLKRIKEQAAALSRESDKLAEDIFDFLRTSPDEHHGALPHYARKITALQIISANLTSLATHGFNHVDNNHRGPDETQAEELTEVGKLARNVLHSTAEALEHQQFDELDRVAATVQKMKEFIRKCDQHQMKRIRAGKSGTRHSLLFISTLAKVERIAEQALNLLRLYHASATDNRSPLPEVPSPWELTRS